MKTITWRKKSATGAELNFLGNAADLNTEFKTMVGNNQKIFDVNTNSAMR